ncbi:hypothetical protein BZK40_21185 [Citrobacter portucalensis]|nr:hypothetical protein [Salmonella enterica]OPW89520.1 hypothetical protein BZK40_21185 [Citrobacter portucalensis]
MEHAVIVTKRDGQRVTVDADRIHKAIERAAEACAKTIDDELLLNSYLDYAMSVIVGRALPVQSGSTSAQRVVLRHFYVLLPSKKIIKVYVICLKKTLQKFSICDALFTVTTIQLLKASSKLARSPPPPQHYLLF